VGGIKKIKYWDLKSDKPALVVDLPDKFYCGDVIEELAVIGTAGRKILIYNLAQPGEPHAVLNSPLKFQNRCIACFPDKSGYALGTIEGRVSINYLNDTNKNFIFKCHRRVKPTQVFSVNSIAFHPTLGSFATCGSDGSFHFWDKEKKRKAQTI